VDLGGETPVRLAAGLAGDLQIPDERAITMLTGWVAGACRTRIVDVSRAPGAGFDWGWEGFVGPHTEHVKAWLPQELVWL
jgi:hypothetical protein